MTALDTCAGATHGSCGVMLMLLVMIAREMRHLGSLLFSKAFPAVLAILKCPVGSPGQYPQALTR